MSGKSAYWVRLPGLSKRYAPRNGVIPASVRSKNGSISTRQFNALSDDARGYAKERKFQDVLKKENAKKKLTRDGKRNYIKYVQEKTGKKLTPRELDKDASYRELVALLKSKTKSGKPNKTDLKRALIGLGYRDGIPWAVAPGDSHKKYKLLKNNTWVPK